MSFEASITYPSQSLLDFLHFNDHIFLFHGQQACLLTFTNSHLFTLRFSHLHTHSHSQACIHIVSATKVKPARSNKELFCCQLDEKGHEIWTRAMKERAFIAAFCRHAHFSGCFFWSAEGLGQNTSPPPSSAPAALCHSGCPSHSALP